MSVIVAIKDNDRVVMACDSQATCYGSKETLANKNNYKIFEPQKNVLVGVVGAVRHANLLYCIEEYIDELTVLRDEVDFKYIVNKVVSKIISTFNNNSAVKPNSEFYMNSIVLFAYKNQLYKIHGDGSVIEYDEFTATGSGQDLALGVLNNGTSENKRELVINAVKSACSTDLYVNYPIIVMDTLSDKAEVIGG